MRNKKLNDNQQIVITKKELEQIVRFVLQEVGNDLKAKKVEEYLETHIENLAYIIAGLLFIELNRRTKTKHIWNKLWTKFRKETSRLLHIKLPGEEHLITLNRPDIVATTLVQWVRHGVIEKKKLSELTRKIHTIAHTGYDTKYFLSKVISILQEVEGENHLNSKHILQKFNLFKKNKKDNKNKKTQK